MGRLAAPKPHIHISTNSPWRNCGYLLLSIALLAACNENSTPTPPSPSPGLLQFSSATYTINEANGTVSISIVRTGGDVGVVSVSYSTSNGTATAGADYSATSGTLTWSSGDTAPKSFNIPIVVDAVTEGNETVFLTLSAPVGGAALGGISNATLTISDDPGALRFSLADYTVQEDSGSVTVNVARVGGSNGPASVRLLFAQPSAGTGELNARGTAAPGSDYTLPPTNQLSWPDGDGAPKSYTIPILYNSTVEGDETISLALCESTGAAVGSVPFTTITIAEPTTSLPPDGILSNLLDNATGPVPLNIPVDITFSELLSPTGYNQNSIVVTFRPSNAGDMSCDPVLDPNSSAAGAYACSGSNAGPFTCNFSGSVSQNLDCRVPGNIVYDSATRTLQFSPTKNLPEFLTAAVTITIGAVVDQDGNASSPKTIGILTIGNSSFVDTASPTLVSRTPGVGATAPTDTPINIVLNDFMMNTTTLNTNNYRLSYINGGTKQLVAGTISFTKASNGVAEEDMTVTFHPACPLKPATVYTVELTDGIRDFARNKLTPQSWTFTTQP